MIIKRSNLKRVLKVDQSALQTNGQDVRRDHIFREELGLARPSILSPVITVAEVSPVLAARPVLRRKSIRLKKRDMLSFGKRKGEN